MQKWWEVRMEKQGSRNEVWYSLRRWSNVTFSNDESQKENDIWDLSPDRRKEDTRKIGL